MAGTFDNKVALVTGASSGIGASIAAGLIAQGARVAVTARRLDRLEELGKSLGADRGRLLTIEADVRQEADAEALVKKTLDWGGQLDILVNNAGLSRGGPLEAARTEDIHAMLDTNVFALINLSRLALPALKAAQGDIINIASTIAKSLIGGSSVYGASKTAVAGFSESLRKELCDQGVRVLTIYPGLVQTEFFDGFDEAKRTALLSMADQVGALSSQDVADTVLFALTRPRNVSLNEIVVRPTKQP